MTKVNKRNRLVEGVGINDADYSVYIYESGYDSDGKYKRRVVSRCPFYVKWVSMLVRCYNSKYLDSYPTYLSCTVCGEWLTFSKFKFWMEQQDWEGKHLDKDVLFPENKVYSPETCVFVDQKVNKFLTEREKGRGDYPIGVSLHKNKNEDKFKATCNSVETGKSTPLGTFDTPEEAHNKWLDFKLSQAYILASEQTDKRVATALISRYENYKGDK